MKIVFDEPEKAYDSKPTRITYGYDRHVRSWCIIVEDQEGNEVESSYIGTLSGCMKEIDYFKSKYGIDEVIRYKAY